MNRYLSSITMLGIMAISSCENREKVELERVRPVAVEIVKQWNQISYFYTGGVEAEVYSNLSFPFGGPLIELTVERGERISKGNLIAAIDPLKQRADYNSKQIAYLIAKSQWERNIRLLEKQAVSQQDYELSKAAYLRAKTAFEISENRLANTELIAPFDGIVTQKYVENYQWVNAQETVIRLMDPQRMEVVFLLPETSVELLEKEWQVAVEFDYFPGYWFIAEVKDVVDASLDGSGIPVRLSIIDSLFQQKKYTVLPGFTCRVRIIVEDEGFCGCLLPLSAILKDGHTDSLWVWRYDTILSRVVRQSVVPDGLTGQFEVRIVSGLRPGDWVVVSGGHALIEGEIVKVITH